jgi:predicted nucleic acid-binding protein
LNKVCIDASLALAWLSYGKYTESANTLRREWLKNGVELLGPPVFHADVLSVLRNQVFLKKMLPEEGEEAIAICLDIPISIVDGPEMRRTSWRLATEASLAACYDTTYLAVAEIHDCELWTADKRLASLARGAVRTKWLGDYGRKAPVAPAFPRRDTAPGLDDPGLWRRF